MKKINIVIGLIIIVGMIFVFSSCKEIKNPPTECEQTVIVSAKEYENAPADHVTIAYVTLEGDCLKIRFSASGCDGKHWIVKLIDSGIVAESYPVQRTLRLSLENKEMCDAYIGKEISFDIRKLQVEGNDKVSLHIGGKSVLYEY